jgi:agmatine deiminase
MSSPALIANTVATQTGEVPAASGYYFPAEWHPHTRTWLIWPFRSYVFRASAKPAQAAWAVLINQMVAFEDVTVICPTAEVEKEARAVLNPKVETIVLEVSDSWARDTGPSFLLPTKEDEPLKAVHWNFNGYGAAVKGWDYEWSLDQTSSARLLTQLNIPYWSCPTVLEGGSFHCDGEGSCIVTEECLLHPNRRSRPDELRDRASMERVLRDYLGVTKIIWLPQGLYADRDTDGHVDNLACFSAPGSIILAWTDDSSDPQHAISARALEILEKEIDAKGRKLRVHKLHCPDPLFITKEEEVSFGADTFRHAGDRLPASYVNFALTNGAVFVPGFGQPKWDANAVSVIEKLFPSKKVIQVYSREILLGGGNIHCITQQQTCMDT